MRHREARHASVAAVMALVDAQAIVGASTAERADYGDAPDGRPTGYGPQGEFPALLKSDGARAAQTTYALLGKDATRELDSLQVDQDRRDDARRGVLPSYRRVCNDVAEKAITMALPKRAPYVVVGAGIHGLSTAYHLANELRARGLGSGADVLVLDKAGPGAGASGIACGVVRNNYFQPAMSELMQACVEVWESDPVAYAYNPVGYIALGAARQESDLTATFERQERIGYGSELVLGEAEVDAHMKALFPDWRAQGVTVCLHEHQGGFAFNMDSVHGLYGKCRMEGVSVVSGVEVTGLEDAADGSIVAVATSEGRVEVGGQVVVAPGPWAKRFWSMLGLPETIDVHTPSGDVVLGQPMWTYWNLQEGEVGLDPMSFATADGGPPPVIHLDTDAPLYTDEGELVTDELWGIYFKRDRHSVQGGASPLVVDGDVELDPYPQTTDIDPGFPDLFCAGLSHAMARFEGCRPLYKVARSGGVGAFTVDNFPVFDYFRPNLYAILDSNHGYKMIGVGREVAHVLLGEHSRLLYPFRFERFETGDLHPVSSSPYPWS